MSSQGGSDTKPDMSKLRSSNSDRKGNKKGRFKNKRCPTSQRFKGETDDLEGHIYDVGTRTQAEQFTKTTKKLASYAGRTCKEPQDIQRAIEELKEVTVPIPSERLGIANDTLRGKLYEKDIEIWSKRESLY